MARHGYILFSVLSVCLSVDQIQNTKHKTPFLGLMGNIFFDSAVSEIKFNGTGLGVGAPHSS